GNCYLFNCDGEKRKDHFQDFVSFRELDRTDRTHFSLICGAPTARLSPAPSAVTRRSIKPPDLDCGRRCLTENLVLDLHGFEAPLASGSILRSRLSSCL